MYQLLFVSPSSLTRIHYLSCIPPLLGESTNILSHLPLLRIYIILTRNLPYSEHAHSLQYLLQYLFHNGATALTSHILVCHYINFIQIYNPQSKIHTQISNHNLFHSAATSILQFLNFSILRSAASIFSSFAHNEMRI